MELEIMKRKNIIAIFVVIIILLLTNMIFPFLFRTNGTYSDRSSHLSIYSDEWDGLSSFRKGLDDEGYDISTIISNPLILTEVDHPENALYICVGVEKGYDRLEVDFILDFINKGGNVLIADDYGDANSLAKEAGVRFTGHRIWSRDFEKNLSFIRISASLGWNDYSILLNDPTTLLEHGSANTMFKQPETLLHTSRESYEDTNDNGRIDTIGGQEKDKNGELPVGVEVKTKGEAGKIIIISDSSFCINEMWDRHDNAAFSLALVEYLIGPEGTVIFDESRHIQSTPIENSIYTLENIYIYILLHHKQDDYTWTEKILTLVIGLAFLNLFGLAYAMTKPPKRFRHKFDLTYQYAFVEQAPDRLTDMRQILLNRLKAHYNLYFPDSSLTYAYEPSTKTQYNLMNRQDIQALIRDPELIDFLLHPSRYSIAARLNVIVMKIDAEFPLTDGMY